MPRSFKTANCHCLWDTKHIFNGPTQTGRSYTIGPERPATDDDAPPGAVAFDVSVTAANGSEAAFVFTLARQEWGLRAGAWQTKFLRRKESI